MILNITVFLNLIVIVIICLMQLEEELRRARYVLSEGDAASFLPSKSQGVCGGGVLCCVSAVVRFVEFE